LSYVLSKPGVVDGHNVPINVYIGDASDESSKFISARKWILMLYGQLQYYCDELKAWARLIQFNKAELQESLRQITLLSNNSFVSAPDSAQCNSFTDQLIVQEQQFDYLVNQIDSQLQRLERTSLLKDKTVTASDFNQQDRLRSKMKGAERAFTNTKFNCSTFLSSFLNDASLAMHT
jgi:hypothetical protein